MWHVDCETNNETTAIARQQLRKYTTVFQPLLGSGPCVILEVLLEAMFSVWSAPKLYHSTDRKKSQIRDSKIWSQVLRDSDPRKTALARASSIYKRQTRPLVREGAPQKQDRNCQAVISI
jgi:hypothetical protein